MNRHELIHQTAARLQQIRTIDDMKASEEDVYTLVEAFFQSSIDTFRSFIDNMEGIPDDELQKKAMLFQDESFLLPPEIMTELERMDSIEGDREFIEFFSDELEKRIDPYIDQFGPLTEKLMDKLMSGSMGDAFNEMVGGVEDAMGSMAEAMDDLVGDLRVDMVKGESEPDFVFDFDNIETPRMMYELYSSRSLEDLDPELLVDEMEEQLQNDVWELEAITDANTAGMTDDALERVDEIRTRMKVFESELDKELTRIGAASDQVEEAAALKKEIMSSISLKVREIKYYLAKL